MAAAGYFPPAAFTPNNRFMGESPPLHREAKIAGLRHPPLPLRPSAPLRVLARSARRQVIATKAAMSAVDPAKELFHDRP
jgi:hypothetical protein